MITPVTEKSENQKNILAKIIFLQLKKQNFAIYL
jgi:hypothetical protein